MTLIDEKRSDEVSPGGIDPHLTFSHLLAWEALFKETKLRFPSH